MSVKIKVAQGAGAYVSGVDLNNLSAAGLKTLRTALGEHGVLFFREQSISPESHIHFAEQFGAININRFFTPLPDHPQIAQVLKEPEQDRNIGQLWHTDHSYDQVPALGSILVARQLPTSGGDTLFVSMFAAFDALSQSMKDTLKNLTATHSSRHVFGDMAFDDSNRKDLVGRIGNSAAATQDAVHPLVIRHPISGKQALYVNPQFTVRINELSETYSDSLLSTLYEHAQAVEFMHEFKWEDGSVAFWDNRATWHKALNDYPGQRRLMHRITVEGEALKR